MFTYLTSNNLDIDTVLQIYKEKEPEILTKQEQTY